MGFSGLGYGVKFCALQNGYALRMYARTYVGRFVMYGARFVTDVAHPKNGRSLVGKQTAVKNAREDETVERVRLITERALMFAPERVTADFIACPFVHSLAHSLARNGEIIMERE